MNKNNYNNKYNMNYILDALQIYGINCTYKESGNYFISETDTNVDEYFHSSGVMAKIENNTIIFNNGETYFFDDTCKLSPGLINLNKKNVEFYFYENKNNNFQPILFFSLNNFIDNIIDVSNSNGIFLTNSQKNTFVWCCNNIKNNLSMKDDMFMIVKDKIRDNYFVINNKKKYVGKLYVKNLYESLFLRQTVNPVYFAHCYFNINFQKWTIIINYYL